MSRETGGYAFPIPNADFQTFQPETIDEYKRIQSGMTLRDYFAAKAMQSLTCVYWSVDGQYESGAALIKCQAETAYEMADAMLKARGEE